jgi:hypothetical protein
MNNHFLVTDEARRNGPVKTASFASNKQQAGNTDNRQGRGSGRGRGGHSQGRGGGQQGMASTPAAGTTTTTQSPATSGDRTARQPIAHCTHCNKKHAGGTAQCRKAFPHLIPPSIKAKWEANAANHSHSPHINVAAVSIDESLPPPRGNAPTWGSAFMMTWLAAENDGGEDEQIAETSDQAKRLADRADYKDRTILDTGASDHICNNYDRFSSFDIPHRRTVIKTGGGKINVKATGTINLAVHRVDGAINTLTLNGVLYASDLFLSCVAHSKIRAKGYFYHGWDDRVYAHLSLAEVAYTPEIDGVPNFLHVEKKDDGLGAANALASQYNSSHTPPTRKVTLRELHETFGYAYVAQCASSFRA